MTDLILIRHGQTDGNFEHRWQGWTDSPLNEMGHRQAALVARRLSEGRGRILAVYSSPLMRAYQTARPIAEALGLPVRLVEGLKELHFGAIEGLTTDEVEEQAPGLLERATDRLDLDFTYPGGENRLEFLRRVADTMDGIVARHPDEMVVVVAHGGTLRAILAHFLPEEIVRWQDFSPGNCSLTYLAVNGRGVGVHMVDDREHLRELAGLEV